MASSPATAAPNACDFAAAGDIDSLRALPVDELTRLDSKGSAPIHWAASCGQLDTLRWLIVEGSCDPESEGNQSARSKRRRPLHWAARNGQLAVVRYLVEEVQVNPDPRDKQSVSPFQLAVWQCWLDVCRFLVEEARVDVTQVNSFACGAQHWLGTVPPQRAGLSCERLLPMASWLLERGVDFAACQRQGHRPLHKAAWGGHLELCMWLRDHCGACDDLQDHSGNFAADIAEMGGNHQLAEWLRAECSGARARSCAVLGLPASTTCEATIRARYLELARRVHPDRNEAQHDTSEDFDAIRSAYVHLTQQGGRGQQSNPTHSLTKMLMATAAATESIATITSEGGAVSERCRFFKAKLVAVCHEYGTAGIPVPSLRKKYAEVWRGEGLPSPEALGLPARASLLKMLAHFDDAVHIVPGTDGAPARLVAVVSRATALGLTEGADGEHTSHQSVEGSQPAGELAAESGCFSLARTPEPTSGGDDAGDQSHRQKQGADEANTRVSALHWPLSELQKLPEGLRPQPGQTLDLILDRRVLLLQTRRGYRANTDSMLLPFFAATQLHGRTIPKAVADVGCGNGLVGILAALQWPGSRAVLFERQTALADLARRNAALNGLAPPPEPVPGAACSRTTTGQVTITSTASGSENRAEVVEADLAQRQAYRHGAFDCVLCNPPFYQPLSPNKPRKGNAEKEGAWVESTLSLDGFVSTMADMLCDGGAGFLVHDAAEEGRLFAALQAHQDRLRLVRVMRMVHVPGDTPQQSGRRIFVHLVRGDYAGTVEVPHTREEEAIFALHVARDKGAYSKEIDQWIRTLPPPFFAIRS